MDLRRGTPPVHPSFIEPIPQLPTRHCFQPVQQIDRIDRVTMLIDMVTDLSKAFKELRRARAFSRDRNPTCPPHHSGLPARRPDKTRDPRPSSSLTASTRMSTFQPAKKS
jgi:hypothetical protein